MEALAAQGGGGRGGAAEARAALRPALVALTRQHRLVLAGRGFRAHLSALTEAAAWAARAGPDAVAAVLRAGPAEAARCQRALGLLSEGCWRGPEVRLVTGLSLGEADAPPGAASMGLGLAPPRVDEGSSHAICFSLVGADRLAVHVQTLRVRPPARGAGGSGSAARPADSESGLLCHEVGLALRELGTLAMASAAR